MPEFLVGCAGSIDATQILTLKRINFIRNSGQKSVLHARFLATGVPFHFSSMILASQLKAIPGSTGFAMAFHVGIVDQFLNANFERILIGASLLDDLSHG